MQETVCVLDTHFACQKTQNCAPRIFVVGNQVSKVNLNYSRPPAQIWFIKSDTVCTTPVPRVLSVLLAYQICESYLFECQVFVVLPVLLNTSDHFLKRGLLFNFGRFLWYCPILLQFYSANSGTPVFGSRICPSDKFCAKMTVSRYQTRESSNGRAVRFSDKSLSY